MVRTIAGALAQVKEDLPRRIERHVLDYLAEHPQWAWRDRQLTLLRLVLLFVTQVLHGNSRPPARSSTSPATRRRAWNWRN